MFRATMDKSATSKGPIFGLVAAALMAAAMLLVAEPAHARDFTVLNTNDSGAGSSRRVIDLANVNPGTDTIKFAIPGEGVKTISPTSELPTITEAVTIDGYSQPGSSPNTLATGTNARLLIQLDGSLAGSANGLEIVAGDVVVRGLAIGRFASDGIEVDDEGLGDPSGVRIEGNFIGTSASGTAARPNNFNGLNLSDSGGDNTIGGTSPSRRNLISGNGAVGVNIPTNDGSYVVEGNLIGTRKDGTTALGNDNDGVHITGSSSDNVIGGSSSGAANTIAFNGRNGVSVFGSETSGNRILGNAIFSNGGLGIDLGSDGPTANDPGDADAGANGLQNKPKITSATSTGTATTIRGTLNSTPNETFLVQFFSNPTGANEGKTFRGQISVTTDANGDATFALGFGPPVPAGKTVTATATGSGGDTSELSAPRVVAKG